MSGVLEMLKYHVLDIAIMMPTSVNSLSVSLCNTLLTSMTSIYAKHKDGIIGFGFSYLTTWGLSQNPPHSPNKYLGFCKLWHGYNKIMIPIFHCETPIWAIWFYHNDTNFKIIFINVNADYYMVTYYVMHSLGDSMQPKCLLVVKMAILTQWFPTRAGEPGDSECYSIYIEGY